MKVKRGKLEKETKAVWSQDVYKITTATQSGDFRTGNLGGITRYKLDGKDGFFMRHELLKVDD